MSTGRFVIPKLGFVTRRQMIDALVEAVEAVENPATGVRVVAVPEIRAATLRRASSSAP